MAKANLYIRESTRLALFTFDSIQQVVMRSFCNYSCNLSAFICLVVAIMVTVLSSCRQEYPRMEAATGQLLLEAVVRGDGSDVFRLLGKGVYTEVRDENGYSPLLIAVKNGNVKVVKMLLTAGADYEARSQGDEGVLELALDLGSEEMTSCLLESGASPDEVCADGDPAILKAAALRDLSAVELLLKYKVKTDAVGNTGRTALHIVAEQRFPKCLTMLLAAGADTEVKDVNGATPLWYALSITDKDAGEVSVCLEPLLRGGADASTTGVRMMPILSEAVRRGTIKDVRGLISHGANVNLASEEDGLTPVAIAAASGSGALLELLFKSGADGGTQLYQAVVKRNQTLLELLLTSGASPNSSKLKRDDSIVACSVRSENTEMLELLLSYGANPMAKGKEGESPLHMAIAMGNADMVASLLKYGHDPNLHFAKPASADFLAMTKKKSMRWFLGKEHRLTPFMMAANNGAIDIIRLLMAHGAKRYDRSGRYRLYPLNFATRRSDINTMQVILGQDPQKEKFHAVIDLSDQRMKLYAPDGKVLFTSRVSTGKQGHRTPTGEYVITDKHTKHNSSIYGSSMPYFQRLSSSAFGFHSGDCPGYPASHGCVRMPDSAAKRLFSITPVGTRVVIQK